MSEITARLSIALADRYRIESHLGEGGMANVYLAEDLKHARKVAVKVLRPELAAVLGAERFLHEINVTANLQHPHILQLYDSGEADTFLYYVMPFVDGQSLRDRLKRERQLPMPLVLDIAKAVGGALDFAHQRGVVHRDVKPENILLQNDLALVADFGIALAMKSAGGDRLTQTGLSVGTPAYMSPEQVAGERDLDARSDVYSLACVVYEMLAGDPPFVASSPQAVMAKHVTDPAPPVTTTRPGVPPAVAKAIAKALNKAAADRYDSARAFVTGLHSEDTPEDDGKKSLVVLPFANHSPDADNAFFADGLTEEIIASLARLEGLRVISRNSAMALKGTVKDTPAIARELSVTHVVTGSVRRAGSALRVMAELVDAEKDTPVWSDRYTGTIEDVFGIQDEIAQQIVNELHVTLTESDARLETQRPVNDTIAYDCYLRARQEMYQWTPDSMERAQRLIDEALAIVGDNPLLLAMRGQITWMFVNIMVRPDRKLLAQAEEYANRALSIDPDHYLGIFVRGALAAQRGEVEIALERVRRAAELQPGDANVINEMIRFLNGAGLPLGPYGDELMRIDPLTPITWLCMTFQNGMTGRLSDVASPFRRMTELAGAVSPLHVHAATFMAFSGHRKEAIAMLDEAGAAFEGTVIGSWAWFLKYAYLEDPDAALPHLTPELEHASALVDHNARSMAEACSLLGRIDDAVRWTEIAINRSLVAYPFYTSYNPFFANVRTDERFQRLMQDLKPKWQGVVGWYRKTFDWSGPIGET